MNFFKMNKPRGYQHKYIYYDERKEKLAKETSTFSLRKEKRGAKRNDMCFFGCIHFRFFISYVFLWLYFE